MPKTMVSRRGNVLLFSVLLLNCISYIASDEEVCFSSTLNNKENVSCKGHSNIFDQIVNGRYKRKTKFDDIAAKGE